MAEGISDSARWHRAFNMDCQIDVAIVPRIPSLFSRQIWRLSRLTDCCRKSGREQIFRGTLGDLAPAEATSGVDHSEILTLATNQINEFLKINISQNLGIITSVS